LKPFAWHHADLTVQSLSQKSLTFDHIKTYDIHSLPFLLHFFSLEVWSVDVKGTVSIISSDPPCKDGNVRIYNGTLETWMWSKIWKLLSFFWLKKCLFLWVFPLLQNNQKNRIWKKIITHWYLIHTWTDKAFKCTVLNRALPSLHGGSLEI